MSEENPELGHNQVPVICSSGRAVWHSCSLQMCPWRQTLLSWEALRLSSSVLHPDGLGLQVLFSAILEHGVSLLVAPASVSSMLALQLLSASGQNSESFSMPTASQWSDALCALCL